jgi:hypothetical protein
VGLGDDGLAALEPVRNVLRKHLRARASVPACVCALALAGGRGWAVVRLSCLRTRSVVCERRCPWRRPFALPPSSSLVALSRRPSITFSLSPSVRPSLARLLHLLLPLTFSPYFDFHLLLSQPEQAASVRDFPSSTGPPGGRGPQHWLVKTAVRLAPPASPAHRFDSVLRLPELPAYRPPPPSQSAPSLLWHLVQQLVRPHRLDLRHPPVAEAELRLHPRHQLRAPPASQRRLRVPPPAGPCLLHWCSGAGWDGS